VIRVVKPTSRLSQSAVAQYSSVRSTAVTLHWQWSAIETCSTADPRARIEHVGPTCDAAQLHQMGCGPRVPSCGSLEQPRSAGARWPRSFSCGDEGLFDATSRNARSVLVCLLSDCQISFLLPNTAYVSGHRVQLKWCAEPPQQPMETRCPVPNSGDKLSRNQRIPRQRHPIGASGAPASFWP